MKLNKKGYLIVEIIVASVIAMTMMYFLMEITIKIKNINEDYYIKTKLETDKVLMTREIMKDINSMYVTNITTHEDVDNKFIIFTFDTGDTKMMKLSKDGSKTIFKYGESVDEENQFTFKEENDVYTKTVDENLTLGNIDITNDSDILTLKTPATNMYLEQDYGLDLAVSYKNNEIEIVDVKSKIISCDNLEVKTSKPSFANIATTDEGLYSTTDNYGTSCYYRGAVTDNYVKFAGYYFRIIRIDGKGNIRMIYDGTYAHNNGSSSTNRQIGESSYYECSGFQCADNADLGYMLPQNPLNVDYLTGNYGKTHANEKNSDVKTVVDNWYKTTFINNVNNKDNVDYIAKDALYCNDRKPSSGKCYSNWAPCYYSSYERLFEERNPNLECNNSYNQSNSYSYKMENDQFTYKDSTIGNKKLEYPVGMITADEVSMAGGVYEKNNTSYYLYTGQDFWTMTPLMFTQCGADVWVATNVGSLDVYGTSGSGNNQGATISCTSDVANEYGVRPVLSLIPNIEFIGKGTSDEPYEILIK